MSSFRSSILNLGLDSRFSSPSATRLYGKGQLINRLISRHGRIISRLVSCFFPSQTFFDECPIGGSVYKSLGTS